MKKAIKKFQKKIVEEKDKEVNSSYNDIFKRILKKKYVKIKYRKDPMFHQNKNKKKLIKREENN